MKTLKQAKVGVIALAFAGIPLVTMGTCDPATGMFDFFRDDDGYYYDSYYYDPYYYDSYYYEPYYYDGYYYEDYWYEDYYYDDCFFCFP